MELEIIILILGITLGFYIQTIVGFAAGLVAIPIIINFLDIKESVALVSIFFFVYSIVLVYQNWRIMDRNIILELSIGLITGMIAGVYILKFGSPIILKKALGIFIILFALYSLMKKRKIKIFKKLGLVFGFLGGLFAGLFSTGGPPNIIYIYNKIDKARVMRATMIGILSLSNFIRVPMLIISDILTMDIFMKSLIVFPFFILALLLGHLTYKKINEETFKKLVIILLFLSGLSLIIR